MCSLILLAGCNNNYEVLADKLDINMGFTVNPCKVKVYGGADVSVELENKTNETKYVMVTNRMPDKVSDGYIVNREYNILLSDTYIELNPKQKKTFTITVDKSNKSAEGDREAWISITELTEEYIKKELIVRVLITDS